MSLTIALVFHFNQHLNQAGKLASAVCYTGLLRTLRRHPTIKANIHISGTLLHALRWLDPQPLALIADGLAAGQFALLGSTYAQNVPYATDDRDNALQIDLHRSVLAESFDQHPTVFWNAERCWRQSLLPVIVAGGYDTTLVEDHILRAAGLPAGQVCETAVGDQRLKLIYDDETFKHHFNMASWFGKPEPLRTYLAGCVAAGQRYIAYAEDAEALGLWGYWHGIDPRQTWARLDVLLAELAELPNVTTGLINRAPSASAFADLVPDGSALWMDGALQQAGRPYHEDGYANWFDFNANSPKLKHFRQFYDDLRPLVTPNPNDQPPAAQALRAAARQVYLANQYEFGCVGIGSDTYRGWLGANGARVLALAADRANQPNHLGLEALDVNGDQHEEVPWQAHGQLAVFSPIGGRLLYWINLHTGQQRVGNPQAEVWGPYLGDSIPPTPMMRPQMWLPSGPETPSQLESPPTRFGRYLPDWVWQAYDPPFDLATRSMPLEISQPLLNAQRRAFTDQVVLNGVRVRAPETEHLEAELKDAIGKAASAGEPALLLPMAWTANDDGLTFKAEIAPSVTLQKTFTLDPDAVTCIYTLTSTYDCEVQLATEFELTLDSAAILQHGQAAFQLNAQGVRNQLTGEQLIIETETPLTVDEVLLAWQFSTTATIHLTANQPQQHTQTLRYRTS